MTMSLIRILISTSALSLAACGGSAPQANAPPPTPPTAPTANGGVSSMPSPTPMTFAEQAGQGQKLFADSCAKCHGASGTGGKAPPLVGLATGALPLNPPPTAKYRKNQFRTVADIADFVTKNMPPNAPGSLTAEQYWSILAFDLKANGINLDKKLDPNLARTLTVPR
jgi:cytochrome c